MIKLPLAKTRAWWISGLVVGAVVLLAAVAVILLVDDWRRDLTQNTARTDPEHPDPLLRDIETTALPEAVAEAVESFVQENPHWQILARETMEGGSSRLRLVRTTRQLRFKDDLTVDLSGAGPTRISVSSASRVGKADFGQNPRNIRELTSWLSGRLPSGGEP